MKIILIVIICFLFSCSKKVNNHNSKGICTKAYDPVLKRKIYSMVDEMPFGNEDFSRLSKFIRQHINYSMEEQGVVGKIVFSFVVDSDGSISDRKIFNKNESEYSVFEREFLKAFEMMNYWRPGKCAGKAVPLRVIIPMSMNWQ